MASFSSELDKIIYVSKKYPSEFKTLDVSLISLETLDFMFKNISNLKFHPSCALHVLFKENKNDTIITIFKKDYLHVDYDNGLPLALAHFHQNEKMIEFLKSLNPDMKLAMNSLISMIPNLGFNRDPFDILDLALSHEVDLNNHPRVIAHLIDDSAESLNYVLSKNISEEILVQAVTHIWCLDSETIKNLVQQGLSPNIGQGMFFRNAECDFELCRFLLDHGFDPLENNMNALKMVEYQSCRKLLWDNVKNKEFSQRQKLFLHPYCKYFSLEETISVENISVCHLEKISIPVCDMIGRSGEDDHIAFKSDGMSRIDFLYGVYDGHGEVYRSKRSGEVINYMHIVNAAINGDIMFPLHHYIEIYLELFDDVREAIKQAFIDFDTTAHYLGYEAGACVTMLISIGGKLYAVNLGDSRIVITDGTYLLFETQDHEPENERERIVKAGGFVANKRVNGVLAVSRALLDSELKGIKFNTEIGPVIGVPDVTLLELPPGPKKVIISSDAPYTPVPGHYTSMTMIEALKKFETLNEIGEDVRKFSNDDITIMIVELEN